MSGYEYIKAKGRVAIIKDGEFDHQQFRSHWAYRNPEAYIAKLIAQDVEAAEYEAECRAARLNDAKAYLAERAERKAMQPGFDF
jgi:hypothetical protein